MKEFVINEFLSLKLENGITNIYVNDKKILRCKAVLIEILIEDLNYYDFESIDEYIDKYKKANDETKEKAKKIPLSNI